jgi:hypothetical protein
MVRVKGFASVRWKLILLAMPLTVVLPMARAQQPAATENKPGVPGDEKAPAPKTDTGNKPQAAGDLRSSALRTTIEDFSEITLKNSKLTPVEPTYGGYGEKEKYIWERFQVQWRDLDPIDLFVVLPKGVEKPPVILYLYSYPASNKPYMDDGWCERVTRGGYAAVGFVPALDADRYRMRPRKQWFVSELQESLGSTVHDVQMVLNQLESWGTFDMSRVGIFGIGSGATVAILAAAADPRIKAIDLFEPWGDWPNWLRLTSTIPVLERDNYLKKDFLAKIAPLDPTSWLGQLKTQKIRWLEVDSNTEPPRIALQRMEAVLPKDAVIEHFEDQAKLKEANSGGKWFQWVKDQLQPPSPANGTINAEKPPSPAGTSAQHTPATISPLP